MWKALWFAEEADRVECIAAKVVREWEWLGGGESNLVECGCVVAPAELRVTAWAKDEHVAAELESERANRAVCVEAIDGDGRVVALRTCVGAKAKRAGDVLASAGAAVDLAEGAESVAGPAFDVLAGQGDGTGDVARAIKGGVVAGTVAVVRAAKECAVDAEPAVAGEGRPDEERAHARLGELSAAAAVERKKAAREVGGELVVARIVE